MLTDKTILTLGDDPHGSSYLDTYAPPAVPDMSGPEKAAILMITIGLELSASIFKFLRQDEVERIVLEIAKISTVSIEKRDAVIQEAYQRAIALKYINEGGIEYAKEILERSFGAGQGDGMPHRLFAALKHGNPLELVKKTEPAQLLEFIKEEHPQTIPLILVYMSPDQAGAVLSQLDPELQGEVAMRIAILQKTAPEILEQLTELLGARLLVSGSDFTKAGGVQSLASVMGFRDRDQDRQRRTARADLQEHVDARRYDAAGRHRRARPRARARGRQGPAEHRRRHPNARGERSDRHRPRRTRRPDRINMGRLIRGA